MTPQNPADLLPVFVCLSLSPAYAVRFFLAEDDVSEPRRYLPVLIYLNPASTARLSSVVVSSGCVTCQNHTAGDESVEAWTGHLKHSRFDGGITGTIEKFSRGHDNHAHAGQGAGPGHAKSPRGEEKSDGTCPAYIYQATAAPPVTLFPHSKIRDWRDAPSIHP